MGQVVSGTERESDCSAESSNEVDSDQETLATNGTTVESQKVVSNLYHGSSTFLQSPFMNRDFSTTCGCIIAQEREKPMASSLLEHKCAEQNDISNCPWAEHNYFSTETQLPRRRSSIATTTKAKGSPKPRPSDQNLHDFLSLLVTPSPSSDDTTDLEELILLMKAHSVTDSTIIPQHLATPSSNNSATKLPSLTPDSFKFNFASSDSHTTPPEPQPLAAQRTRATVSFAPASDFKFSFSADRHPSLPTAPPPPESSSAAALASMNERPTYRRGGVYLDDYEEMDNQDDGNEDQEFIDPRELEAIIQQRKILPLPKPRWKRKVAMVNEEVTAPQQQQQQQQEVPSSEQLKAEAVTSQRTPQSPKEPNKYITTALPGISLPQVVEKQDNRKIAVVGRRWKVDEKPATSHPAETAAAHVDEGPSLLPEATATKQRQQHQEKISQRVSKSAQQGSSRRNKGTTKKKKQPVAKVVDQGSEEMKNTKGKRQTDTTKKGKKQQQQQQQQPRKKEWLDADLNTSDISLVRSNNPDDWICSFCQYEILCSGLEAARRKRGYRRQRLRAKVPDDVIINSDHLSDEEDPLSLVEVPVDSRIRVVAGLSPGPNFE